MPGERLRSCWTMTGPCRRSRRGQSWQLFRRAQGNNKKKESSLCKTANKCELVHTQPFKKVYNSSTSYSLNIFLLERVGLSKTSDAKTDLCHTRLDASFSAGAGKYWSGSPAAETTCSWRSYRAAQSATSGRWRASR